MNTQATDSGLLKGIDLLPNSTLPDWQQALQDGVAFVYLAAVPAAKDTFAQQWTSLQRSGLARGACFYLEFRRTAIAQMEELSQMTGRSAANDLPPAVALRTVRTGTGMDEWHSLTPLRRQELITEFLAAAEQTFGRKPLVFTNTRFLRTHLQEPSAISNYPLWIEDYVSRSEPSLPPGWSHWALWRRQEAARVKGIPQMAGISYFRGAIEELLAMAPGTKESKEPEEKAQAATAEPDADAEPLKETASGEPAEVTVDEQVAAPIAEQPKKITRVAGQPKKSGA